VEVQFRWTDQSTVAFGTSPSRDLETFCKPASPGVNASRNQRLNGQITSRGAVFGTLGEIDDV
jgi:hypothetical protein